MNTATNRRTQRGFGILEILIVLIVVGVGLLAIVNLQGEFMAGSGLSKARSEAVKLAQSKQEELQNAIEAGLFDTDLPAGTATDTVDGLNASFTRSWEITPDATIPNLNNVQVTVSWTPSGGDATEQVTLDNFIAFSSPVKSASNKRGLNTIGTKAPSPNDDSGEVGPGLVDRGEDIGDGWTQENVAGSNKVLIKDTDTGELLFTANNGLLSISGTVYIDEDNKLSIDDVWMVVTDAGICAWPLSVSGTGNGFKSAQYTCYAGVGWRGKVGLSGIDDNAQKDGCPAIAREYYSVVLDANGDAVARTGINNSYSQHDFLVKEKNDTCAETKAAAEQELGVEIYNLDREYFVEGAPDYDGDLLYDFEDNCPLVWNQDQLDSNADGVGDACDGDGDGVDDSFDNCPDVANSDQLNTDGDLLGDACDPDDDDADGVINGQDNCPVDANTDQTDTDGDGAGDVCDDDDDNDGVLDLTDNCPLDANADQADDDADGTGNACDLIFDDADSDGVADALDNCPADPNGDQTDTDEDGIGDACEPDPIAYTCTCSLNGGVGSVEGISPEEAGGCCTEAICTGEGVSGGMLDGLSFEITGMFDPALLPDEACSIGTVTQLP